MKPTPNPALFRATSPLFIAVHSADELDEKLAEFLGVFGKS